MANNRANMLVMSGASLLFFDYLDKRYFISRDLATIWTYMKSRNEIKRYLNKNYTYADFWEEKAKINPHKVCIVCEGVSYTFMDAEKIVNRVSHYLIAKGIKKGDIVAIFMESRPQFIFTWLALSKLGAISALLNSNQKGVQLWRSIQVSTAKTIIYGTELDAQIGGVIDQIRQAEIKMFCEGESRSDYGENMTPLLNEFPFTAPDRSVRAGLKYSDVWGFIYTSGTTGFPKASVIKHQKFIGISVYFANQFGITSADRTYTSLPLYHTVAGLLGVGIMIYTTGTLVLRKKFSATHFWRDVRENQCTVMQYSGELCRYLLSCKESTDEDTKHKIRLAMGNGLRPEIWQDFQTRFNITEIGEFYAATEGNVMISHLVKQNGPGVGSVGHVGPISKSVGGIGILACYDTEKDQLTRNPQGFCIECKPGEVGELLGPITSSSFSEFAGYYGNPEGTNQKIIKDVFKKGDTYYRTGDLLKRDHRGFYYFVDRIGDNYRWKGENISTLEVSEAISAIKEVQEANIYGIQLPKLDGRVGMAAIVPMPGITLNLDALAHHVANTLPSYSIPVFLRLMPQMTVTDTFKHRKVDLRKEGINLDIVQDPLYIFNHRAMKYEPLTRAKYNEIMVGKARL